MSKTIKFFSFFSQLHFSFPFYLLCFNLILLLFVILHKVGAIVCTKVLNLLSSSGLQSFSACRGNSQLQRGGIKIKARKGALQYAHSKSPLANKKKTFSRFIFILFFYFSIFCFSFEYNRWKLYQRMV